MYVILCCGRVAAQMARIQKHQELRDLVDGWPLSPQEATSSDGDPEEGWQQCNSCPGFVGPQYSLLACDLRETAQLEEALIKVARLDPSLPTLFVSECVLVYLDPHEGDQLLKWTSDTFPDCGWVVYEQVNVDDPFGRTMVENLNLRGAPLLGLERYSNQEQQHARFLDAGFSHCVSRTMLWLCDRAENQQPAGGQDASLRFLLSPEEWSGARRLEWLDEVEEWRLIQGHYLLLTAVQGLQCAQDPEAQWSWHHVLLHY